MADEKTGTDEAHEEHLRLAGLVKSVHADLRKKYKRNESDLEKIWAEHCQNKPVLTQYAEAMHHLAVDHWAKNRETRIDWCRDTAIEYFYEGGLRKALEKETRKRKFDLLRRSDGAEGMDGAENDENICQMKKYNSVFLPFSGRIRLLDVGSCFNPFFGMKEFQAVGIDISPAKDSVFHCDFLHLETMDPLQVASDTMTTYINNLRSPIELLPRECFHVVVFSLLLEYFPAPYQRWLCCQKAHKLLTFNGILLIVTPDSHQQHRNSAMVRSWKQAIESMGFVRVKYIKQEHLHCMAFRKVQQEEKLDNLISDITPDMMYIPQDLKHPEDPSNSREIPSENELAFRETLLQEMPLLASDSDENASN